MEVVATIVTANTEVAIVVEHNPMVEKPEVATSSIAAAILVVVK